MELAAPPAVARGPELGRVPAADLEPVRVRRHVDQRREAGVRDGAVVALEEVLRDDLPVRLDAPLRAVMEPQRVDVDAELRDLLRHRTERHGERLRVGVRVHEEERPPALEAYGSQSDGVELEVGPRRRPQAAVEPVRPGVVRALKRLSVSCAFGDHGPAVSAHVDEGTCLAVLRAGDDDRDPTGARGEEVAGPGDGARVADVLPGSREDPLLLERPDVRRRSTSPTDSSSRRAYRRGNAHRG